MASNLWADEKGIAQVARDRPSGSAMMKPQSVPGQVVKESLNGQIIPVVNWEIMDEYKKVLRRLKFGFDPRDVSVLLKELEKRAVYCGIFQYL